MRVAIYARVSTADQDCEPQLRDVREYVAARGWRAVEFIDQGVSGARERRPALDRLLAEVKARKVDVVVVAAFDRFGRSVRHLVETLELFRHLGVEFVSLREQIDTGSPLGQAVFTIIAAIAQLERSLIAERVRAGLRRARAEASGSAGHRCRSTSGAWRTSSAGSSPSGRPRRSWASRRRRTYGCCGHGNATRESRRPPPGRGRSPL